MFIRFQSPAGAAFSMPREAALTLIKMMGASGGVPGALGAEDVPQALERLRQSIAQSKPASDGPQQDKDKDNDDEEPRVQLATRAYPLIQLLTAAAKKNEHVMWQESSSALL